MPEGVHYQIIRADKAGCPAVAGYIFTDPAEAAATSRRLAKEMGEKLMVKPIVNNKWRERETLRVINGTYRRLPWDNDRWWGSNTALAIHKDHFAHPSIEKPGWLAYTKSPEDGAIDKQTILRPGAYLKRYFERVMHDHGCSERALVESFMRAYGPLDIKFAATEDEIISVYETGPETCMRGKPWPGDGRNPAYIYAAGDLQVAYLGELHRASARVLVWPEKKIFSRIYGDIARLTQGLERMGYKWGAPIGARLKRVSVKPVKFNPMRGPPSCCFIAPYIDKMNQRGGGHLSILDKGDHLVICEEETPGSHHCGLADGHSGQYVPRADEYPTFTCDSCDVPGFRELRTVYATEDQNEEYSWCTLCVREQAFHCHYSGEYFAKAEIDAVMVQGHPWAKHYADMYAAKCEKSGEICHVDSMLVVYIDGKMWNVSSNWVDNQGGAFRSGFTNRLFLRSERVRILGYDENIFAGKPELKYHAFQCDACQNFARIDERGQPHGNDKLFCYRCNRNELTGKKSKSSQMHIDLLIQAQNEAFSGIKF